MPLTNDLLVASLRRSWPLFGAIGILIGVMIVDRAVFEPTATRYKAALKQAGDLGMALDPEAPSAILPPRLFALLTDNSLPAAEAESRGNSGTLTAQLLEDLTALTGARGIQVAGTEPGPISQQATSVTVRAHVRLRCHYDQFVALLADLAKSGKLYAVDRFTLSADAAASQSLELWVSRTFLKRGKVGA